MAHLFGAKLLVVMGLVFFCSICTTPVVANGAPAAPTNNGQPGVADFVRRPDFSNITISPDGTYLAALVPQPHENVLAILDAHTAKVLHLIPSGHGALIANYFWFNDNRLIAALAIKNGGLDTPALTGELFAINPDGTPQVDLSGFRSSNSTETLIATTGRRCATATPIGGTADQ